MAIASTYSPTSPETVAATSKRPTNGSVNWRSAIEA
jgi:hypothetical protein